MDGILRFLNLLMVLFTGAMTIVMLFTFRKERPIGRFSALWSAGLSLLILLTFVLLSGARLDLLLGVPVFGLGLVVGFLRGLATRLYAKDGQVVRRNSLFFLLGWGSSLALAQLFAMLDSALLASVGLLPLVLTTGTQVGLEGNIFLRRLMMRTPPPAAGGSGSGVRAPAGLPEREHGVRPSGLPERG
jgi:hypothetical protein